MKKSLIVIATFLTATSAFAQCFNFVNGQGPGSIGNTPLAATASRVCIQTVQNFSGRAETQLVFSDAQGTLAILGTSGQSRCAGACNSFVVSGGSINGQNANVAGVEISIQQQLNQNLGVSQGSMEIKFGRGFGQRFLLIGGR